MNIPNSKVYLKGEWSIKQLFLMVIHERRMEYDNRYCCKKSSFSHRRIENTFAHAINLDFKGVSFFIKHSVVYLCTQQK